MTKRKSQFTEELQKKYPSFRKRRDDFEAKCIICIYGAFVSMANKDRISLNMHIEYKAQKAIKGEASSAKETNHFYEPDTQTEDNMLPQLKPPWHFIL